MVYLLPEKQNNVLGHGKKLISDGNDQDIPVLANVKKFLTLSFTHVIMSFIHC